MRTETAAATAVGMGVKGKKPWSMDVERPCVVLTGEHNSGKTARMDSLQLAFSGRSSAGASARRLAELCPGEASVTISCEHWEAKWWAVRKGDSLSSKTKYTMNGLECQREEITGRLPSTVKDFLSSSGEEQWGMLCGLFAAPSTPEWVVSAVPVKLTGDAEKDTVRISDSIMDLVRARKQLESATPPAPYSGESVQVLSAKIDALSADVGRMRAATAQVARIEPMIKSKTELISRLDASLTKANEDLVTAIKQAGYYKGMADSLAGRVEEPSFMSTLRAKGETRNKCITTCLSKAYEILLCAQSLASEGKCVETRNLVTQIASRVASATDSMQDIPDWSDQLTKVPGMNHVDAMLRHSQEQNRATTIESDIARITSDLALAQEQLSKLIEQRAEAGGEQDFSAKAIELEELRSQQSKAQAWIEWGKASAGRDEKIASLNAEIKVMEDALSGLKKFRADDTNSNLKSVCDRANSYLWDGFAKVSISVNSKGKIPYLEISNEDGVAFSAMSGSQQVVYGMVLLVAMQDLSPAPFPVVFQECAEVSPELLKNLAEHLGKREKGCVFLSHYLAPNCDPNIVMEIRL